MATGPAAASPTSSSHRPGLCEWSPPTRGRRGVAAQQLNDEVAHEPVPETPTHPGSRRAPVLVAMAVAVVAGFVFVVNMTSGDKADLVTVPRSTATAGSRWGPVTCGHRPLAMQRPQRSRTPLLARFSAGKQPARGSSNKAIVRVQYQFDSINAGWLSSSTS